MHSRCRKTSVFPSEQPEATQRDEEQDVGNINNLQDREEGEESPIPDRARLEAPEKGEIEQPFRSPNTGQEASCVELEGGT